VGGFFAISLGGNIGDVRGAFRQALLDLSHRSDLRLLGTSVVTRTRPWGVISPDFLNMVVVGYARIGAPGIFSLLLRIERRFRRRGKGKLYPRTLDLDFLEYSGPFLPMKDLLLPHPRLHVRPELGELLLAARRRERSVSLHDTKGGRRRGRP
jgi:2-amino-4-hydroxy-6-hydroxymethyldihydropteridine diphosphokinase